jgi:hypothetical protein
MTTFVQALTHSLRAEWENTGGGCMAIVRRLSDGSAIVVTDREDVFGRADYDTDDYVDGAYVQHVRGYDEYQDESPTLVYESRYDVVTCDYDTDERDTSGLANEAMRVADAVRAYLAVNGYEDDAR